MVFKVIRDHIEEKLLAKKLNIIYNAKNCNSKKSKFHAQKCIVKYEIWEPD
jgi:hypothetical protein